MAQVQLPAYLKRPRKKYPKAQPVDVAEDVFSDAPASQPEAQPTVAAVDAKLAALAERRAQVEARLTILQDSAAEYLASGQNVPNTIDSEIQKLGNALSQQFPIAKTKLETERRQAAGNDILREFEVNAGVYAGLQAEQAERMVKLKAIRAELDALANEYDAANVRLAFLRNNDVGAQAITIRFDSTGYGRELLAEFHQRYWQLKTKFGIEG